MSLSRQTKVSSKWYGKAPPNMGIDSTGQINELLEMLVSDNLGERLVPIQVLGDIRDEEAPRALREQMAIVSREHYALVVAVGKLKRKLGMK